MHLRPSSSPARGLALIALVALSATACKRTDATATAADGDAAAAASPSILAAIGNALGSTFEGAITMHATSAHGPAEDVTFLTKGNKLRVDAPAHNGQTAHIVFDPNGKTLVIMDQQKMYMELDHPAAMAHPTAAPATPSKITHTGKHETIAGYDCEDIDVAEANGKHAAVCMAEGISFFDFSAMGPGGSQRSWISELKDKHYFPLRAVEQDASGKETSRMEVTKIEKRSIDDALFAVPPGYHTMQIPSFGSVPTPHTGTIK